MPKATNGSGGNSFCQCGKTSAFKLKGAYREMYEPMSEKDLQDIAKTKRKKLPMTK